MLNQTEGTNFHERRVFSVSELTRKIKSFLEPKFEDITVEGEISNFKRHTSGHLYFSLKDSGAQLSGVMWRSRNASLGFLPQDGMLVKARGNISLYEARGSYQLDCYELKLAGEGELQRAFEQLKQKLFSEGLFDENHKRKIPLYPERIGIVTSPTGAAIRDIVQIISRRFPSTEIILFPVLVQGENASKEIAQAIRDFNVFNKVDVLIVGRGGGSLEDLWAFNSEEVARAIYDSTIPIISAVGHEIDFTIADFVADLRAPTPSAAAELVVPNSIDVWNTLRTAIESSHRIILENIRNSFQQIHSSVRSYAFHRPFDTLRQYIQKLDEHQTTLQRMSEYSIQSTKNSLESLSLRLASLNPQAVLRRGYAIVSAKGKTVSSAQQLRKSDTAEVQFHNGKIFVEVVG
ncbi:MAG: exodeoxyribonuclease VII large subunit [Ignavibacteriales bacterium]|nr:exodeoxyribonuclease VII large subunit [Ignavibacteriales bacterium]